MLEVIQPHHPQRTPHPQPHPTERKTITPGTSQMLVKLHLCPLLAANHIVLCVYLTKHYKQGLTFLHCYSFIRYYISL